MASPALAAEPAAPEKAENKPSIDVIELTVRPARLPRPAMKYRLLPQYPDQTPGNAAALYRRAALLLEQFGADDNFNTADELLNTPEGKLPPRPLEKETLEKVRQALGQAKHALRQAEMASRRDHCDWGLPIREVEDIYGMMLTEIQSGRSLARWIALKARLQVAEGNYKGAVESLKMGFALSRDMGQQPTLVFGLVGYAVSSVMCDEVLTLIEFSDVPNLYWTITNLPSPMFDLRRALELEGNGVYLFSPEFQEAKRGQHTPEQWQALFSRFVSKFAALVEAYAEEKSTTKLSAEELLQKAYPTAKRELISRGRPESEVNSMPPAQAVLLHAAETWDELRDETFKWFNLPYWQAEDGLRESRQWVETAGKELEVVPLASMLLPAVSACHAHVARHERRFASLRCIEAIRLYAATHDGKLPGKLTEITEVPIPINPATGKPFAYRLEGDTAVLDADGANYHRQYRIKLAK